MATGSAHNGDIRAPNCELSQAPAGQAARDLFRLLKSMEDFSKQMQRRHGVTGPQLWALWELRQQHELGTSSLARRMYLHPSTVTGIADRLEAKGLITRHRDLGDHRRVRLSVTPAGLELIDRAPRPVSSRLSDVFERLDAQQAGALADALGALVAAITDDS